MAKHVEPLRWQDPPPPQRFVGSRGDWDEARAALRSQPGRWALLRTCNGRSAAPVASKWRAGLAGWTNEFEIRAVDRDGYSEVYVRYRGGDDAAQRVP